MIAEFALSISIALGPVPAPSQRGHRSTLALIASSVFLAEGVADCTQTKTRIFRFGTTENNPFTPKVVLEQFHRDHAGLCNAGFFLSSAALYFATRRMDPAVSIAPVVIEGVNLLSQAHDR